MLYVVVGPAMAALLKTVEGGHEALDEVEQSVFSPTQREELASHFNNWNGPIEFLRAMRRDQQKYNSCKMPIIVDGKVIKSPMRLMMASGESFILTYARITT